MPKPGHSLGDTNIVSLEGVEGDTKSHGSDAESPHGEVANEGYSLLREVVDDGCPGHVRGRLISGRTRFEHTQSQCASV